MNKKRMKSDLRRIDRMKDEDIDYSDIPELDAEFFATARVVAPPGPAIEAQRRSTTSDA